MNELDIFGLFCLNQEKEIGFFWNENGCFILCMVSCSSSSTYYMKVINREKNVDLI